MTRDIKFRGKRIDNGNWVYGDGVVWVGDDYCAIPQTKDVTSQDYQIRLCKVVLETVGQYTGLKDKDDIMIFEGDKIKHNENVFVVEFESNPKSDVYGLILKHVNRKVNWRDLAWLHNVKKYIQIVGNIHEPPELIP